MNDAWSEAEAKLIDKKAKRHIPLKLLEKRRPKKVPDPPTIYYVPYYKLHALATRIFGQGNWKNEVRSEEIVEEYEDAESQNASHGIFVASVGCCVRVTIKSGVFREDVGTGRARGHSPEQALVKAKRFAKIDATKRALRQFGAGLGNCLQDKEFQRYVDLVKSGK